VKTIHGYCLRLNADRKSNISMCKGEVVDETICMGNRKEYKKIIRFRN